MRILKSLALASTLSLAAGAAWSQDVVIRYAQWLPPTYFLNERVWVPYFEEIERVTEGRVVVEQSAGPLGPPPRNYQMVLDGVADMSWAPHGFTPGAFPLSEIAELPFQSSDAVTTSLAYWRVFKETLEPAGMHPGVVTLAVHTHPPGQMFNNQREITSGDDFDGLKIRTTNSAVSEALTRLGATPVGMPVTEMRDALEKGIVDGVSLTDEAIYSFRVNEFLKYELAVPGGLYNTSFFIVMNPAKWAEISPEDQEAIMAISGEALITKMTTAWQEEQDASVQRVIDDGITITEAEGPLLAYIEDKLEGVDEAWVERANNEGIDGAAALAAFRSYIAELE